MTSQVPEALRNVKALTFDVFGTVVDHRTTVCQELIKRAREKIESPAYSSLPEQSQTRLEAMTEDDWAKFGQEWRYSYYVFTRSFVPGESEWKDIDTHHYDALHVLLRNWGLTGIYAEDEVRLLSRVWHNLKPWDDSAAGIQLLGTRLVTSTLSNGNHEILQDLNAYGDLGFREIISTADFGAYKPHPSTYLGAAEALGLRPEEVAMVAAHLGDLAAARSNGLRTIYVERPQEEAWGSDDPRYKEACGWVDIWVAEGEGGFLEVARRLGISE
ncbi:haloacid dehalogenase [Hypoxylon trugodes]|uniref:haloacid dehalogenase n=1 Tax=Hypoxylon trugodes TaxID=326681 RepID=UPI0021919706|nr:haloacid dehalogenase [Hypoxylon trugodes]KAI1389691.1 haloacid dehalogenase [Hypoxylon trugodes]